MQTPVFAMITDFGIDFAVASMKALVIKNFPNAQIVDIDHSIQQFSILSGAFVIDKIYEYFPKGTIFICVVDPGVGSKRKPIFLDCGDYKFIGPNNGLFHFILKDENISCKPYIIKEEFWPKKSTTFHGRDLFTPAAIEIARDNFEIIEPLDPEDLVTIPELNKGENLITYIDGFGNIKTNVSLEKSVEVNDYVELDINGVVQKIRVSTTFSEVPEGALLCYRGSNNTLEIAANLASAKEILGVKVGDKISIK